MIHQSMEIAHQIMNFRWIALSHVLQKVIQGKGSFKWGLEDLVQHWLTNLSFKPEEMGKGEPEDTLARAGFTNAIHDAMVVMGDTL
jgi:hypothetical protein